MKCLECGKHDHWLNDKTELVKLMEQKKRPKEMWRRGNQLVTRKKCQKSIKASFSSACSVKRTDPNPITDEGAQTSTGGLINEME